MKSKVQLVQTTTSDDLILTGLYSEGSKDKEAIVYMHGFEGDFYTNSFLHLLADDLSDAKHAFVLAQNRGTGQRSAMAKRGRLEWLNLGSYYEKLEDAHLDISAWIDFLKEQGYSSFILIGHSLGTIKVTRYLFEGEDKASITKLVLLAPFDKNGYVENKTKGEWHNHLRIAEQKIKDGKALEIIPDTFDDFPMTYQNYYSWYNEYDLNLIWDFYRPEYISPILQQIQIPVQVVIGDKDEAPMTKGLGGTLEKTCDYLKNNIKTLELKLIEGANHGYVNHEDELAESVISFIDSV